MLPGVRYELFYRFALAPYLEQGVRALTDGGEFVLQRIIDQPPLRTVNIRRGRDQFELLPQRRCYGRHARGYRSIAHKPAHCLMALSGRRSKKTASHVSGPYSCAVPRTPNCGAGRSLVSSDAIIW